MTWTYPQSAIVATVRHERPHHGVAVEHFLPGGPFAILPLKGNRSSLVWTERKDDAERARRRRRFRLPDRARAPLRPPARRDRRSTAARAFPLGLTLARDFVRPRFALLGRRRPRHPPDRRPGPQPRLPRRRGARRDVVEAARLGLDIGAADVLRALRELAALRHLRDGRHDRRPEPPVLQRHLAAPRAARHRPRPRRPPAAAEELFIGEAAGAAASCRGS